MVRQYPVVVLGFILCGFMSPVRDLEQVKQELREFAMEQNRAKAAKDRAALERLYADEFLIVHGLGYVDNKNTIITEAMEETSPPQFPVPTFQPPQSLHVSGDFAIAQNPQHRGGEHQDNPPNWSTSIFVHRDGRWQLLHKQNTRLVVLPPMIALAAETLPIYSGIYRTSAGDTVRMEVRDDGLYSVSNRVPARKLIPIGENLFTTKLGGEIRFNRNAAGKIIGYINLFRSREITATRLE